MELVEVAMKSVESMGLYGTYAALLQTSIERPGFADGQSKQKQGSERLVPVNL